MDYRLTEEQIERIAEQAMDKLDNLFLSGKISQEQYDSDVSALDRWGAQQYEALK